MISHDDMMGLIATEAVEGDFMHPNPPRKRDTKDDPPPIPYFHLATTTRVRQRGAFESTPRSAIGEYTIPLIGIPEDSMQGKCDVCGRTKHIQDLILDFEGKRFICTGCHSDSA